jgi:hypothetical protein
MGAIPPAVLIGYGHQAACSQVKSENAAKENMSHVLSNYTYTMCRWHVWMFAKFTKVWLSFSCVLPLRSHCAQLGVVARHAASRLQS